MIWHKTIGNGPAKVMMIHGWFWDHRVYTPILEALDADRYTYAFFDIHGYGNSRDISGPYSIGGVAADAIALADQLGWKEFHVVGHSMGGKAAQKIAMDAADVSPLWWRSLQCQPAHCHSMTMCSGFSPRLATRTKRR